MFEWINNIYLATIVLIVMIFVINKASDTLGDALHVLGVKLKVPNSVRGATFDAVSSSFPEFSTAMVAVIVYKEFADVGVPTIAGSGIFNILLIPMLTIFAYKGSQLLKADRAGVIRDMVFYTISIVVLMVMAFSGAFTPLSGTVLLLVYVGYIVTLYIQTKKHQRNLTLGEEIGEKHELQVGLKEDGEDSDMVDMSNGKIFFTILITMTLLWLSSDAIVQSALIVSSTFNIPKIIIAVVILAACTSIPDTLLSIKSARLGDADGAVSNAVGSNIFDICVCLGVPMIIAGKSIPVNIGENIVIFSFLLISMLTTALLLLKKKGVGKKDALIMAFVYGLFIAYIACVGFGLIPLNLFA